MSLIHHATRKGAVLKLLEISILGKRSSRRAACGKIRRAPNGAESGVEEAGEGLLLVAGEEKAREFISFALSGVAWFAAHLTITREEKATSRWEERTFTAKQEVA
jgi:hypothetical protein